jgi:siderophore synthetase component
MRTVARTDRPTEHIKLPLATATLGLRNRRSIKPGTLIDGVAGQRLIEAVLNREPRLHDRVLVADETAWAHAGHELLATLVRRYPAGLDQSVVVPLAAFMAPAPDGRLTITHLAGRFAGGDVATLLGDVWEVLLDLQVTLFTYGIALESHQQNLSVVLDDGRPPRVLLKDNDGPRIHRSRVRALSLDRWEFDDQRTWASPDALADMVATITVHLCGGAFAFALGEHAQHPVPGLLELLRHRIEEAVDRPGAELLRTRLLEAEELPVKAMVTAGTLLSKERSGAADVNKHYTTGPNYLRAGQGGFQ